MTDKLRIYQAGPVQNAAAPHSWRDDLKRDYPSIDWVDPLAKYDASDVGDVAIDYGDGGDITPAEIVKADLDLIDSCDGVFAFLPKGVVSRGTDMELRYAHAVANVPVAAWTEVNTDEERGPWLVAHVDHFGPTFAENVDYLQQIGQRLRDQENDRDGDLIP